MTKVRRRGTGEKFPAFKHSRCVSQITGHDQRAVVYHGMTRKCEVKIESEQYEVLVRNRIFRGSGIHRSQYGSTDTCGRELDDAYPETRRDAVH